MHSADVITLVVLTPESALLEKRVSKVSLPGTKGRFMVLKSHAPLISSLDEGYIVVTVDYMDHPQAMGVNLDWSLFSLRKGIDTYLGGLSHAKFDIYVVPDGYMLARNILFYDYSEHAKVGTIDRIISIYNTDSGFRTAKGARIPNPDENVTTHDRCLNPD